MSTQQDATVNIHVNNQEAEEKVRSLNQQATELRKKLADAVRIQDNGTIDKTKKELKKVNKELDNARLRAARVRESMKHLSEATPKELRNTLKLINQELNSGAVKRGSKEWKQYQEQIKQVNAELRKIQAESRETESTLNRANNFLTKRGNAIVGGMAAMAGVTMAGKQAVQAYADMDSALANTQKYTGMTREDVERLNEEFKKMDTRTSREGLNELAQAAGRLGKNSVEDVMGFVRAGDIIGVAMDELGADAPQIISQLAGIFNLEGELGTEKAMLSVGSAINTLSQNCAAGAPNLVDFASRMGAIANSTNMSMDEMLAFGALLDDQKVSVEKASTAMQGVITKMYADPATFAKKVGLNVQEFTDALKRSSTEGIMMFVDALSKMDSMQQAATLKDLGTAGAGVVQTFQTLAGKTELLKQQMATSKQAFTDATSATEEFNVQNNTVQAELDKAKKGFNEMAVELGEHLAPVMRYAISGTSLLMNVMSSLIKFVVNNKGAILTLVAAYAAYQIAVNKAIIVEKAEMVITKASTALKYAWTTALKLSAAAVALCTGNVQKATIAWRAFSMALKANPMGLLVGGIVAVGGALVNWAKSASEAKQKAADLRHEAKELEKSYTDLTQATAEGAKAEISALKKLYNAATSDIRSKEDRLAAANKILQMYPNYFKGMNAEAIMAGRASLQYNALTKSILAAAKARAAADKIQKNQGEILDLEMQIDNHKSRIDELSSDLPPIVGSQQDRIAAENNPARLEIKLVNAEIKLIEQKIAKIEEYNKRLEAIAGDLPLDTPSLPTFDFSSAYNGTSNGSSKSTSKQTKEDKAKEDAKKKERELREKAEKEAAEIIAMELEMINSSIEGNNDYNYAQYTQGLIDYRKYTENKRDISLHSLEIQRQALENAGLQETQVYKNILEKEKSLKEQYSDLLLNISLKQLEDTKKIEEDALTSQYLNPSSPLFQNGIAYRQRLFELDIKFLQDKQKLYTKDSEEWLELENNIQERLREDQLQKQQETADAYRHFQEEYGKASGSQREKMELDILDNLYNQKLISEEDYQRARSKIIKKYQDEDRENASSVSSEYTDMVENLYDSWKTFFEELGKEGSNFWDNLSNAATATYAVMAAALSQYSAYADAERDLELAKTEANYDRQIEAAGKNSKKKEQLEKEKEAKIAEIKKKHNERAMKIEIAQAIAQTAMGAIAAYASASAIPVVGWLMGPIAAAMAVAAGAIQIATIKKQHQAEAIGYYEGGYTGKSLDNHKEVGVVHANEFVANHKAVANPRLAPLFNLLDSAQRNNTVGSLTAQDVSNALGQGRGVTARAEVANTTNEQVGTGLALVGATLSSAGDAIDRLNQRIDDGIETVMIMDGERGFAKKYDNYNKLINRAKR